MTSFDIEASAVIAWVVQEDGLDNAVGLIDGPTLGAPDLLMTGCANILWRPTSCARRSAAAS